MSPFNRSRIRQRRSIGSSLSSNSNNEHLPTVVVVVVVAAMFMSLLLLPTTTQAQAYLGPTHCTKPGTTATSIIQSSSGTGYSTFNHLLFDMVSLSTSFQSGQVIPEERLTFTICPGTLIDLDDTSLPIGFLPIVVPRLTLQCGEHNGHTTIRGNNNDPSTTSCTIRGGGRRKSTSANWNTNPRSQSYKTDIEGIVGGGTSSVAQIYVYGESAYEITLRGLTFDNSLTNDEKSMWNEYVAQFGTAGLLDTDEDDGVDNNGGSGGVMEQEYDASVPNTSSSSTNANWGGENQLNTNGDNGRRNLQQQQQQQEEGGIRPAHRFAAVAVRGKGYGDDAGPHLITIEDCKFTSHGGYAILVSPGIQEPDLPVAPEFEFPQRPSSPLSSSTATNVTNVDSGNDNNSDAGNVSSVNLQSSGQIYNGGGNSNTNSSNNNNGGNFRKKRRLNLLDDGGRYIPQDGLVAYYDNTAGENYLDGRRVKIIKSEFVNNHVTGDHVAGLVTSAYSLTLTDCFFQSNKAKAMVFVYNNDALVDNTIFAKNTVEVATVIMASPKGSKVNAVANNVEPTHIVERTCFLGSHVGMSNVLVTDVDTTGFGQRNNHATGTDFTWVSTCEGGAAEKFGNDCLETGNCDGTCVQFTSEKCMADRANSRKDNMLFSSGASGSNNMALALGIAGGLAFLYAVWMCVKYKH